MRFAFPSVRLLCPVLFLVGCSTTSPISVLDASVPDAAFVPDASPDVDSFVPPDVGVDAGPPEGPCFEDVELASLSGGRESFGPLGLFERPGGWLAIFIASSHGGEAVREAVFVDADGAISGRMPVSDGAMDSPRAVLGRFLLASLYDDTRLYEIGDGTLIDRTELLGAIPGRIEAVSREDDRLRILWATRIDPTESIYRFAYSEIVLGDDGELTTSTALLEQIDSAALMHGLGRYHSLHTVVMHEDTLLLAAPTGEGELEITGQVWNVVRMALDRSGLAGGTASWSVIDEARWEEGPISVFGALPEQGVAIAGRYVEIGGTWQGTLFAERYGDATATPIEIAPRGDFADDSLGPATVIRRGDQLVLGAPNRVRVLSLPELTETASAALDLTFSRSLWTEDVVLELGSIHGDATVLGVLRCHELVASP